MSAPVIRTITFKDAGQDFLEWDINEENTVVDCRPFQASAWIGTKVITAIPGTTPTIQTRRTGRFCRLKHVVESIRRRQ